MNTHTAHTAAIAPEVTRMARAVQDRDPATPVPSCPGWDLARLVAHTGNVHRWATAMVRDLTQKRYERDDADLTGAGDDLAGWLAAGAGPLTEALLAADPDAPMWAWGGDRHARFWSRRQLHETVIHRVDAELAAGIAPVIDEAVAADGVDEFLDVLPYARWRPALAELKGGGETISWQTDTGLAWLITLTPDGFRHERSAAPGDVTVRTATAGDLMLLAWRRRDHQDYAVDGDVKLLQWWIERSAI
ncbi:maleylpyruvate isomerase family mycothiol-dependent enzyme [Acrocarpospora catenulata]|uniref:maleylpyruvate isomerase family mycothiol-dependent enzyme n=1 Tax=Acrocarpospora catenulata TaxID=2836182 RepID=UPI001BD9B857|nr:maleylpyruvate isomerase family mycothiol-dependent enzyme [Acrocarpospora catenulata]